MNNFKSHVTCFLLLIFLLPSCKSSLKLEVNNTTGPFKQRLKIMPLIPEEKEIYTESDFMLLEAVKEGNLELVRRLLESGSYINIQDNYGQTPLHLAFEEGYDEPMVKLLLENGADINIQDYYGNPTFFNTALVVRFKMTRLHWAVERGYLEIVKILLKSGDKVNINKKDQFGRTCLHEAAVFGYLEIFKLLLENGADVNIQDKVKKTPLCTAASRGHLEIFKLLLENGADINIKDNDGRTPLHLALQKVYNEANEGIVKLLLRNGADFNTYDKWHNTAFHYAVKDGYEDIVKLLLKNGVDPNIFGEWSSAPLHMAAYNGNMKLIKVLLGNGANVNSQDINGNTLLHILADRYPALYIELNNIIYKLIESYPKLIEDEIFYSYKNKFELLASSNISLIMKYVPPYDSWLVNRTLKNRFGETAEDIYIRQAGNH